MSLEKAAAAVKKYKRFLITAHTNLEGDALGSELAFYSLLKKLGKEAVIINEDEIPCGYGFMPKKNIIKMFRQNLKEVEFDCFTALDCSDLRRTGEVYKLNAIRKPILNIDHHISNQRFADINWVDSTASSCSEMIYRLFKRLQIPLDKDVATLLYTGIVTDTGSFRYTNTTSFTHKAVSELLKYDLDVAMIYKNVYENIPFEDLKLLTRILPGLRREAGGKVVWFQIGRSMLKNKKLSFDLSEHILSFGRAVKGVEVVALFKENLGVKNEIRLNLRSQGKVDVNKVASYFGGGGHKTASGATIQGKIEQVRKKVLAKIKENLRS